MIIDREEINAGSMKFGDSATFNVVLRNNYPEKVKVLSVNRSCTCTEAELEGSSYLLPKGESIVKITIKPGSTGAFSRYVSVSYNREGHGDFKDEIRIKAFVT